MEALYAIAQWRLHPQKIIQSFTLTPLLVGCLNRVIQSHLDRLNRLAPVTWTACPTSWSRLPDSTSSPGHLATHWNSLQVRRWLFKFIEQLASIILRHGCSPNNSASLCIPQTSAMILGGFEAGIPPPPSVCFGLKYDLFRVKIVFQWFRNVFSCKTSLQHR